METTSKPKYGDFMVRKMRLVDPILGFGYSLGMCSVSDKSAYGVFKINHAKYSYEIAGNENPLTAYKVDLEPMSNENFQRRDWYACDVFCKFDIASDNVHIFDDYDEALAYADKMNVAYDGNDR